MKTYWFPALIIALLMGHAGLRLATADAFVYIPALPAQVESAAGLQPVNTIGDKVAESFDKEMEVAADGSNKLLADS